MTTRFTKDHEYITADGTVGITPYAQDQLGDIVFVELPKVGQRFKQGEETAVVESVKAASEIYAPVTGTVTAINEALVATPGLINEDPEGQGWMYRLTVENPAEVSALMDADTYSELTK